MAELVEVTSQTLYAGVCLTSDMTPREAAIAIIESSRLTHVEWAAWLDVHPEDGGGAAADALFHHECVANYDLVLEVLRTT